MATTYYESLLEKKEAKQEQTSEPEEQTGSQIFTVEGMIMFVVAFVFDFAGLICVALLFVWGIGAFLGRAVSAAGLVVFTIWAAIRGSKSPGTKGRDEAQGMGKKVFQGFLKKHWKKLTVEAIPILGDVSPTFLIMWYSELR